MKTRTAHTKYLPRFAGLVVLFLIAFMNGCVEEPGGIVNVCVVPTVIRTSPANAETNVSLSKVGVLAKTSSISAVKVITATFNTPMDPSTLNAKTFIVRQGTDTLAGSVSYSDTTAVFIVPNELAPGLTYTCTLTTGAHDKVASPLAANYVWTFSTIASGTPTLVSPSNGAANQPTNPNLIWNAVPGAAKYHLQVSLSPAFVGNVFDDSTLTGTSKQITGLNFGANYYWRVNAKISGQTGFYSSVWNFTVVTPPLSPDLISPAAAAQNQSTSPTLTWSPSAGAATYRLQVSTSPLFVGNVFDDSTLTGTSKLITGLAIGTTYYWRVNAKNSAGTSAYSTRNFRTLATALVAPTLVSPADSTVNASSSPTLSWNASIGAATYRLQVSTSAAFITTVFDDSTLTVLSKQLTGLTLGTTYFWRVNAKNTGGTSPFSTIWRFTVSATAQPSVNLRTAARFGGMGGSAGVTNQGTSTRVLGSLITTAASSLVTGFHDATAAPTNVFTETPLNIGAVRDTIYTATAPPGSVPGAVATQALADANTAYLYLKGLPAGSDPGAGELGGLTLAPGTYTAALGSFKITLVDLTLDAKGDLNAQFVFQMASSLTIGSAGPVGARNIILLNGAQSKNIFWQVGSTATLNGAGGGTVVGTIIASSGVTISTVGNAVITTLNGRALSLISSVTMVNTVINVPLP